MKNRGQNCAEINSQLAKSLGAYGIRSKTVRMPSGLTPKGYEIREFDEVFKRYLSPQNPSDLTQGDITAVD